MKQRFQNQPEWLRLFSHSDLRAERQALDNGNPQIFFLSRDRSFE